LLADLIWIRCYTAWVDNDVDRCFALINLAVGIDPRPLFFWINGGRMLAYDMPAWRVEQAGGAGTVPDSVVGRITRDQAQRALEFYQKGLLYHQDNPGLLVDMANIHQRKLNDLDEAARHYRMAAEVPNAPYFAGRIYGELLRRIGKNQEAYDWLTELYPTLPADDPTALKPNVLRRIRELERELRIPADERVEGGG
jgi:tetratricopeptide (TPR) repeat protein